MQQKYGFKVFRFLFVSPFFTISFTHEINFFSRYFDFVCSVLDLIFSRIYQVLKPLTNKSKGVHFFFRAVCSFTYFQVFSEVLVILGNFLQLIRDCQNMNKIMSQKDELSVLLLVVCLHYVCYAMLVCMFALDIYYQETKLQKNIAISPNFLVWKFCGKEIARNYAETVPFQNISTPGNQVKLRYFSQCKLQL